MGMKRWDWELLSCFTSVIVRTVEVVDEEVFGHSFDVLLLCLLLLLALAAELFCAYPVSIPCRVPMHCCIFLAKGSMGCFECHVLCSSVQETVACVATEIMSNFLEVTVLEMTQMCKGQVLHLTLQRVLHIQTCIASTYVCDSQAIQQWCHSKAS